MVNNKLKSLRVLNEISQEDMAEKLNINPVTYCNKETGKNEFTVSQVNKILETFDVTYEEVFKNV